MDLSINQGTALRLHSPNLNAPALLVEGDNPYAHGFFDHTSLFNDADTHLGIVSLASGHSLAGVIKSPTGLSAVLGEVNLPSTSSTSAVRAIGLSTNAYLARGNHAGLFSGDLHVNNGQVTKDYNSFPSPMAPAAYGFVNSNGTIGSGTANMSVVWNGALSQYEVSINDQILNFNTHTTIVTVVDSAEPHVATTNTSGGNILVKIWDINSGNVAIQDNFQIVVFNANPNAALRISPVPAGMDPEQYYQQTGTTAPQVPYAAPVEMPEPVSVNRED